MQKALQSMLDGDISKQEKEDYQSSLRIKRLNLEDELNKLRDVQSLNESTITYVCNFMNAPARMWQDADAETKVIFQQMVTENGITFDLKSEKFGTEGLSMFYRLKDKQKDSEESLNSSMVTLPGILGYIFVALRKVNFSALLLAIEPFGFGSRARAIK